MVIVSWRAHWFDGLRSTAHTVRVSLDDRILRIRPEVDDGSESRLLAEVSADGLIVSERFIAAPRMIELPDGGTLQVEDDDVGGFDLSLQRAGHRPGPVYRLIDRWRNVAVCLALLIGVVVWMDLQGAGLMASVAVRWIPVSVDARIGRSALALADSQWLAPSRLSLERRTALGSRFSRLVHEQYPALVWQLQFRSTRSGKDAFNAFALPGGTIVLLDGVVGAMSDEQVLAVLGHELSHVVHRDVMYGIARQMGLLAVAGVVWGQMSGVVAYVAAGVQGLHFTRDVESEADAFSVTFLRRAGIPVQRLAEMLAVLKRVEAVTGTVPTFLSDHPSTAARLRAAHALTGPISLGGITLGMSGAELRKRLGPPIETESSNHWLYNSIDAARDGVLDVYFVNGDADVSGRVNEVFFTGRDDGAPADMPNLLGLTREVLVGRYGEPVREVVAREGNYLWFSNGIIARVLLGKTRGYGMYGVL